MTLLRIEHADPQRGYTRHNTSTYTQYLPRMENGNAFKICYEIIHTFWNRL